MPVSVKAYTDGSYNRASGRFGSGGVLLYPDGRKEAFSAGGRAGAEESGWNINGEIVAAETAVRLAIRAGAEAVEIHYDYEGVGCWADGLWQANKSYTIAYRSAIARLRRSIRISFVHVKGHSGDKWNDAADLLAKYGCGMARDLSRLPKGCVLVSAEEAFPDAAPLPDSHEETDGQMSLFSVGAPESPSLSDASAPGKDAPPGKTKSVRQFPQGRVPADGVNPRCREALLRFFKDPNPSFKDFAALKTYGLDRFSRMGVRDMERVLGRKASRACRFALHNESRYEAALRWVMRGLTPEEAAHKANVDEEIARNCTGRRSRA